MDNLHQLVITSGQSCLVTVNKGMPGAACHPQTERCWMLIDQSLTPSCGGEETPVTSWMSWMLRVQFTLLAEHPTILHE